VKKDIAPDHIYVGLFGPVGIVFEAQRVADLIKQFLGYLAHDLISGGV
jgi:hypothetical protein